MYNYKVRMRAHPVSAGWGLNMGRVKYRVKAAYVIIHFVMNSAGPPRTIDSVSDRRDRRATFSVHLDLRES